MLNYTKNQLFIEQVPLEVIAKNYGTPLYIYSKNQLVNNFSLFDSALDSVKHLTCYAVKANSNFSILKILAEKGAGVDITSGGELYRSLKAGFKPEKIVYAGIGKTSEEIEYALRNNILMFNIESIEELQRINEIAKRHETVARIAFRINPHVDPDTHHYITTGKSGAKFGISHKEAIQVYKLAKKLPNIEIIGIHCHIGSQITSIKPFVMAAKRIFDIMKSLKQIGINLKYVDLGGGLGIKYNKENPPTPKQLFDSVLPIFKEFNPTFIFEPGRYIIGNTGIFLVKVIYRKHADGKNFLIVDGGMNDLIRPTLYEAYHEILPVINTKQKNVKLDVVGPICETGDFLAQNRSLPWINNDGLLAVKCAGAYGFAMSSQYNSRIRPAEVLVDGQEYKLIRDREKYEDLVANEV